MLNAIILAGSKNAKKPGGIGNKAVLMINNRPMIAYVIDALKNTGRIGCIVIVGSKEQLKRALPVEKEKIINSDGSIMDNVMAGIRYLGFNENVLICSCDIPFITSEAVNDFISGAIRLKGDLCYPIVERSKAEAKYPGARRTYVRLREGTFTGGNIFYLRPKVIEEGYSLAVSLLDARKKPLKMAAVLGVGFFIGLLFGNLSINRIEKKFSQILRIKARAFISNFPEIGNDVDKPGDVIMAAAYLNDKNIRNINSEL